MKRLLVFWIFSLPLALSAQENVTTFGIMGKPIFASSYFRTGPKDLSDRNIDFTIIQHSGFSAGGVIRKGFTRNLSAETGISFVKRNYTLDIRDGEFSGTSEFKIIGYEIPLQALVFIQLSREIWMNVALGPSIDIFPSDVQSDGRYFFHRSTRTGSTPVLHAGLIANLGWEWRTKKSGYIYLGASYHRSLDNPYSSFFAYVRDPKATLADGVAFTELSGDYLTFDIRYYFHEEPEKKKRKKK